jgi:peptidoglycan/LPS O-acetylase OafA/YrhL
VKHSGGLDGLRGVAVLVVVLFHARVPFVDGGFLGVSLFFTLSGFLITSLLLAEHAEHGTISLRRFYTRRARRLLPAAYLCLLLVALAGVWWGAGQRADLPGDLIASVANVANWRFAFAATDYADIFLGAPSPVAHFWSLAIEEQIYLVLPLVVVLALRRGRSTLGWVTAFLLAVSLAAIFVTTDRDLVYNGTHTRAAELLVGVGLAVYLARDRRGAGPSRWERWGWVPGSIAGLAFIVVVVAGSLDQAWIYRGGLPVVAFVSAALIAAVVHERFPDRVLDVRPLVMLGRYSYGIYLFHWPVFLLLDAERTNLGPVTLFAVRCVATGVLTFASARLLEQPVRLGRVPRSNVRFVAATGTGALAVVVAAAVVLPSPDYTRTEQLLALGGSGVVDFRASEPSALQRARPDVVPLAAAVNSRPFRVAVIGSERSAVDAAALADPGLGGALEDGLDVDVLADIRPECPLSAPGLGGCTPLVDRFEASAELHEIDMLVIATGAAEDAELDPREAAVHSPPALAELAASQTEASAAIEDVIDVAAARGVDVVLFSAGRRYGTFDDQLVHIALGAPDIRTVIRDEPELSSAVRIRATSAHSASGARTPSGSPTKVLVIGDSTSLSMAMALNDGSDGRLEVLWAGANGCPLAPVEATRVDRGAPWMTHQCEAYATKLPPLVASFGPEAVLVMTGPTELSEHRYPGDPDGHLPGDPAFVAARDRAIDSIAEAAGPQVPVLVADVPAVRPGGFASREMAGAERLAALNAQVDEWDRRSVQIARFPYRDTLEGAETSPGSLRTDGVHPDAAPLEALARSVYVDELLDLTEEMRTELVEPAPVAASLGG